MFYKLLPAPESSSKIEHIEDTWLRTECMAAVQSRYLVSPGTVLIDNIVTEDGLSDNIEEGKR